MIINQKLAVGKSQMRYQNDREATPEVFFLNGSHLGFVGHLEFWQPSLIFNDNLDQIWIIHYNNNNNNT